MSEQALQVYEAKPITIRPAEQVKFAKEAADVLVSIVKECDLAKNLGGQKDHLEFEAWSTIAKFYGHTIKSKGSEFIGSPDERGRYPGAKGYAVVVDPDGVERGGADAVCMRDEENWASKPNFQLASMSQTRAGSKAAKFLFSWVVVLAGYSPTPAEEMTGTEYHAKTPTPKGSTVTDCPFCGKAARPSKFKEGEFYCPQKSCKGYSSKNWPKKAETPPTDPSNTIGGEEKSSPDASWSKEKGQPANPIPKPIDNGWVSAIEKIATDRPDLFQEALKDAGIHTVSNAEQAKKVMDYMDKIAV